MPEGQTHPGREGHEGHARAVRAGEGRAGRELSEGTCFASREVAVRSHHHS